MFFFVSNKFVDFLKSKYMIIFTFLNYFLFRKIKKPYEISIFSNNILYHPREFFGGLN